MRVVATTDDLAARLADFAETGVSLYEYRVGWCGDHTHAYLFVNGQLALVAWEAVAELKDAVESIIGVPEAEGFAVAGGTA